MSLEPPPNRAVLSVIIPAYCEGDGLRALADRLTAVLDRLPAPAEVILVDDHSTDHSTRVMREIAAKDARFQFVRLSRNSGSHMAILAGLEQARGECAVFMAADLQDPPELIPELLDRWRQGFKTVWAVRAKREGVPWIDRAFAKGFYWLLNRFGEVALPPDGADFALIDAAVVRALVESVGANPSIFAEIAKLGFSQTELAYTKTARQFGESKWGLRKKLKLFADTFVAFSYAPIRSMSYFGLTVAVLGFIYAMVVIVKHLVWGHPVEGWASIMVAVLIIGGVQMLMLGVLGEYLWRTLDEARRQPRYFIEESTQLDRAKTATGVPPEPR
jgi:polyisoprenyl-phosphate glycosyltransferase